MAQRTSKYSNTAFSIPELLVVMGMLGILLALMLPSFTAARSRTREVSTLSSCRQIGIAIENYAAQWKGAPPTIFAPLELYYPPDYQTIDIDGVPVRGNWFDHMMSYRYALRSYCEPSVFFAPGHKVDLGQVGPGHNAVPDFYLTETLYAQPSYWNRWTQTGSGQWAAQRLDAVAFPSAKGLVYQMWTYGSGKGGPARQQTMHFAGTRAGVLWADSSASTEELVKLHPGEPNFYRHSFPDRSYLADGPTIAQTLQGVQGRDKGGTYAPPRRIPR